MNKNTPTPTVHPMEEGFYIEHTSDVDIAFDALWTYLRGPDADYSAQEVIRAFAGAAAQRDRGYWAEWLEEDGSPVDEEYPTRWTSAAARSPHARDRDVVFITNGEVW